jgi:hypothetical protein
VSEHLDHVGDDQLMGKTDDGSTDKRPGTGPGEARKVMDDLEATVEAEAVRIDQTHQDDLFGDWAPEVPGSGEPPD